MQHEEEEESGEVLSPEVGESMLHGDAVWFTVQGIADVLEAQEVPKVREKTSPSMAESTCIQINGC